jgi:hypothetical protein
VHERAENGTLGIFWPDGLKVRAGNGMWKAFLLCSQFGSRRALEKSQTPLASIKEAMA